MRYFFLYHFLICCSFGFAQNSMPPANTKIVQEAEQLKDAYSINDDYAIAQSYEKLGNEYFLKNEYSKAESYFLKAKILFEKLKKKSEKARVTRLLAQAQEAQHKNDDAIKNYQDASLDGYVFEAKSNNGKVENADKKKESVTRKSNTVFVSDEATATRKISKNDASNIVATTTEVDNRNMPSDLNINDAERLKNIVNPIAQEKFLQTNVSILEERQSDEIAEKNELSNSYKQLGDVQLQQNKLPEAILNYSNALDISTTSNSIIANGNQLSKAYLVSGNYGAAISVQKKILEKNEIKENPTLKIIQTQNLANIYVQQNDNESALILLQESYDLSIKNNKTIEAKNSVEAMANIYLQNGNTAKSILLYTDFLKQLEVIISKDNSLVDDKILQATEDKIAQLEKEKTLKDELIKKKNLFNYFLIAASFLLLILLSFIIRSFFQIKIKNKKIELQSLRREMNPHFIFNSLNSINQYISQNKELEANKYLSSYSNLMRSMMENSSKDFISLSTELELLKRYLDLEKLRFSDKFDYTISIDELIDTDAIQIPNMLIQPHIENAIWHGLRYKETKGLLLLNFLINDNSLVIKIEDDGIGLTKSKAIKTKNQKAYTSIGISNTQQRIDLLNQLYHKNIECKITELQPPTNGTVVKISYSL